MTILNEILEANQKFSNACLEFDESQNHAIGKLPKRQVAIFTCMDTRLVEFLEPAMGIKRGEAKVIKNAGNSITGPFEATVRSLILAIFELGVKEVLVIGHYDCGVAHTSAGELIDKMLQRGVVKEAIDMIEGQLKLWLDQLGNPVENVVKVVEQLRKNPLIPEDVPIHGLIFDPHTGKIEIVDAGYGETKE